MREGWRWRESIELSIEGRGEASLPVSIRIDATYLCSFNRMSPMSTNIAAPFLLGLAHLRGSRAVRGRRGEGWVCSANYPSELCKNKMFQLDTE